MKIVVEETQLAVYLNDTFLSHSRHRIQSAEIDYTPQMKAAINHHG
ncbi:hypothetical protein A0J48_005375 [Sphaerospermopsis aphanizomenoides BCCUSP55]|nr:hypothetical protein [Sphaerospermopsis aphanizomenoides]MBK1986975.1 hypothetical protein [Sphaerospermopsis aphanizomenoides BCCUSP55]